MSPAARWIPLGALISLVGGGLASCAGGVTGSPERTGDSVAAAPEAPVLLSIEPWSFRGAEGEILRTRHYRIFTTEREPTYLDRLPPFLERALSHYRTSIAALPAPEQRLDTYLMDSRPQWTALTQQLLGARGARFTHIQRGGFATRGIGVFYDIGLFDTFAIAAHEGWHQYLQRTFETPLPLWLDEGLATYMEGHKWDGAEPLFLPWANVERFDHLRRAHAARDLISLDDLLAYSPADRMGGASAETLTYYAQVWALAHFLAEGAGGRHRQGLRNLLLDAANGQAPRAVALRAGREAMVEALRTRRGAAYFTTYFDADLERASLEYASFVEELVRPGSRDAIAAGRSPFRTLP